MTFDLSQFRRMPTRAAAVVARRAMKAHHWRRRCDAYVGASEVLPQHHPQRLKAVALANAADARAQAYQALLAGQAQHATAFRTFAAAQGVRAKAMVAL